MNLSHREILETVEMVQTLNLDVRTVTLGLSLLDCAPGDPAGLSQRVGAKILRRAGGLVEAVRAVERTLGVPVANVRLSLTPVALIASGLDEDGLLELASAVDAAAAQVGLDFVGGFGALVAKGTTEADERVIRSLPRVLAQTRHVCAAVVAASTAAGINVEVVRAMGPILLDAAERTREAGAVACAKLVVFANAVEDNPFMAGAFHGPSEPEACIHVGVSGPGVVLGALRRQPTASIPELADIIKRSAFQITRAGELVGEQVARRLGVPVGIVDLSLAPTSARGDSVGEILMEMGLDRLGAHGTTAALAILNDAVKRGGAMATDRVGGLSGAFIPVSEDGAMAQAAAAGDLTLEKLEAMTAVCSVGLDMIAVPGDTDAATLSAIMLDELCIGMVQHKTTGVRIIPVPGATVGQWVSFGGLLGEAPVMAVHGGSARALLERGGRIPAPLGALHN